MLLKKLNLAAGVDASNLAAKIIFIALKTSIEKVDVNEFVNVWSDYNGLDVGKLKSGPLSWKKSVM